MEFIFIIVVGIVIACFFALKSALWDKPREEIDSLKRKINMWENYSDKMEKQHSDEIFSMLESHDKKISELKELNNNEKSKLYISYDQKISELKELHDKEKSELRVNNSKKISELRELDAKEISELRENFRRTISVLERRLRDSDSLRMQIYDFSDIVVTSSWKEILILCKEKYSFLRFTQTDNAILDKDYVKESIQKRFIEAIEEQYKYRFLIYLYPELRELFDGVTVTNNSIGQLTSIEHRVMNLFETVNTLTANDKVATEMILLKNRLAFLEAAKSNLTAIPYMAEIMADYETYGIEHLAKELNWGHSVDRQKRVVSIHEIRKVAKEIAERNNESRYQLAYLLKLFPGLEDVIEEEFSRLPMIDLNELKNQDAIRDYISKEEYNSLSSIEKNQLALDRYKESFKKTKWQIGRDYELYIGYVLRTKGYKVDQFGANMGLEDLGRDLIAKKGDKVFIIQCKYWSSIKEIHENHINQLYGTTVGYCIENNIDKSKVVGVLVTNIQLSQVAKKFAEYHGINYKEGVSLGDYPCIKCNIGRDEYGDMTKIYHLPFDQQYDSTKIENEGEFYAFTVEEAEKKGFRRAWKHYY